MRLFVQEKFKYGCKFMEMLSKNNSYIESRPVSK